MAQILFEIDTNFGIDEKEYNCIFAADCNKISDPLSITCFKDYEGDLNLLLSEIQSEKHYSDESGAFGCCDNLLMLFYIIMIYSCFLCFC